MEGDSNELFDQVQHALFQSTPSAWRVTKLEAESPVAVLISIHTLRVEGDALRQPLRTQTEHFNPPPPRGG